MMTAMRARGRVIPMTGNYRSGVVDADGVKGHEGRSSVVLQDDVSRSAREAVAGEEQERQLPVVSNGERRLKGLLVKLEESRSDGLVAIEKLAAGPDAMKGGRTLSVSAADTTAAMVRARTHSSVPQ